MNKILLNEYKILLIILLLGVCFHQFAEAQIEHNYLIGPQSTDCDSLDVSTVSLTEAIQMIEKTKFRFQQQFSISRAYGVMKAAYYSCEGENGYLVMRVDKSDFIYSSVPKTIWDELISSPDINNFYKTRILNQFKVISE